MDWAGWIQAVLNIAAARGIVARIEWTDANNLQFVWFCQNGGNRGTAGAGSSMIHMTTPEEFTRFWTCPPFRQPPTPRTPAPPPPKPGEPEPLPEPWERRGVHVPRVPARAVSLSIDRLFRG